VFFTSEAGEGVEVPFQWPDVSFSFSVFGLSGVVAFEGESSL